MQMPFVSSGGEWPELSWSHWPDCGQEGLGVLILETRDVKEATANVTLASESPASLASSTFLLGRQLSQ